MSGGNGNGEPKAPASFAEAIGLERPRCASCFFFEAASEEDARGPIRLIEGAGWCLAQPPSATAIQDQLSRAVTLAPQLSPTLAASRCRFWQSDARSGLDHLNESLGKLVEAMRDSSGNTGGGSAGGTV